MSLAGVYLRSNPIPLKSSVVTLGDDSHLSIAIGKSVRLFTRYILIFTSCFVHRRSQETAASRRTAGHVSDEALGDVTAGESTGRPEQGANDGGSVTGGHRSLHLASPCRGASASPGAGGRRLAAHTDRRGAAAASADGSGPAATHPAAVAAAARRRGGPAPTAHAVAHSAHGAGARHPRAAAGAVSIHLDISSRVGLCQ